MANYQNLKAAISAAIRTNGNQEITGQVLQDVLNSIVSVIGANYTFAGVATPATNPGTPDQNVMYLAMEGGAYTNFSGMVLPAGISLLMWNGSWTSETVMYGDGGVFDISVYKSSGGTLAAYADLAAALGTNGSNVPDTVRKGGMSVKFIQGTAQSSDNKYVQYRLMADEFTIDTTQWAIADEGVYVENPEFVYVKTDKDDRILWAIKTDGGIYYGAGVPQQVIDYIEEKLAELSLDEYEDIVAFLSDYLGSDTTLKVMIDGINERIPEIVESPEFLKVTLDAEDKVLEGIQEDGTKVIGGNLNVGDSASINGDIRVLGNMEVSGVSYKVIENTEYLAAWVDAEDKVIFGLKTDGKTYVGDADFLDDVESIKAFLANFNGKSIDWDALTSITATENPEFIEVETDSEGKTLAGRTADGAAFENVGFSTPKVSIDGHTIKNIEDPEGRSEITTDSEGKIISYRDADGVKHENVGIETNKLTLTEEGMTDFQKALKEAGFRGGAGDWSDYISEDGDYPLHLPIPQCAFINFIGIEGFPTTKTANMEGVVEYADLDGNYFRKKTVLNAHGQQTLVWPKKNITLDLFDSDYDGDAFKVQFGDWVPQDSFHLKAYYSDNMKGRGAVAYKLYEDFMRTRGIEDDRPYRKYVDYDIEHLSPNKLADDTYIHETGARCFPDAFPSIVYLNGEFYGIFAFQLKKHRDNYLMNKSNDKQVHIEGYLDYDRLFGGVINWAGGGYGLEVRNPKSLYYQRSQYWEEITYDDSLPAYAEGQDYEVGSEVNYNGHSLRAIKKVKNSKKDIGDKYDFDGGHQISGMGDDQEIMGSDSIFYKSNNKDMARCAKVKQYINALSNYIPELKALKDGGATVTEIKTAFEQRFNVSYLIDYLIFQNLIGNDDSIKNNCQWTTYDGVVWITNPYDLNYAFTRIGANTKIGYNSDETENLKLPFGWCWVYYTTEMAERYTALKDAGVIDAERIVRMIQDWQLRIGEKYYKLENDKWPAQAALGSVINTDFWKEVEYDASYPAYDETQQTVYEAGAKVNYYWDGANRSYEALTRLYAPHEMQLLVPNARVSIFKWKRIIENNISVMDGWFED